MDDSVNYIYFYTVKTAEKCDLQFISTDNQLLPLEVNKKESISKYITNTHVFGESVTEFRTVLFYISIYTYQLFILQHL